MQIVIEVPNHYLDAAHQAPDEFARDAKFAMAVKLFEMKRLSSGMAANLTGVDRVTFLGQLQHFGVSAIDLDEDEVAADVNNA